MKNNETTIYYSKIYEKTRRLSPGLSTFARRRLWPSGLYFWSNFFLEIFVPLQLFLIYYESLWWQLQPFFAARCLHQARPLPSCCVCLSVTFVHDVLDLWTKTATIRRAPAATHQWIYIYRSLQHARLRRRQNGTVYAVLNLKHNLRSTYCSEANDRHEHRAASVRQQSYLLHHDQSKAKQSKDV